LCGGHISQSMIDAICEKKTIDELKEQTPPPMHILCLISSQEKKLFKKGIQGIECNLWMFLQQTQFLQLQLAAR
ncbi:Hypothetical predicted protein, partial [Paramuricea clavata]